MTLSASGKYNSQSSTESYRGYGISGNSTEFAAATGKLLTVRKAKFGLVYIFIGAHALKVDHGAKSPEEAPFIERFKPRA
jgi:hypothetical protein